MRSISAKGLIAAVLFSALAPTLVLASQARILDAAFPIFLVALGHAAILGLPLFLILHRKGWVNAASSVLGGFAVGAIPIGLVTLPVGYGEHTNAWVGPDRSPTIVDGTTTLAGWLGYIEVLGLVGGIGAFAGFVFWLVLRLAGRAAPTIQDAQPRGRLSRLATRQGALLAAAVLLSGAVLSIPTVTKDRTCHNMFRDGRRSVGAEVRIDLKIEMADWERLAAIFETLGKTQGLSFRDSSRSEPGIVRIIGLSLCNDDGTNLEALDLRWAAQNFEPLMKDSGVQIGIYVLRNEADWQPLARRLVEELEAAWPGKVTFTGPDGRVIAKPAVLD